MANTANTANNSIKRPAGIPGTSGAQSDSTISNENLSDASDMLASTENVQKDMSGIVASGLPESSSPAQMALRSQLGSSDTLGNLLGGAAAGNQAYDPRAGVMGNMINGFMAGLQVPAKLYAAKQQQLKATIDATPLKATYPEIAKRYPVFSSMPTAIALEAIQNISKDAVGLYSKSQLMKQEAEEQEKLQLITKDNAPAYAKAIKLVMGDEAIKGLDTVDESGNIIKGGQLIGMKASELADYMRDKAALNAANKQAAGLSTNQLGERWNEIAKSVNPIIATRGSQLGQIGQSTLAANKAITTLNNPKLIKDHVITTDLAIDLGRMLSGGVPGETEIKGLRYNSISGDARNLLSYVTGNPNTVITEAQRQQLLHIAQSFKAVNNQAIDNNFRAAYANPILKADPRLKQSLDQYISNIREGGAITPISQDVSSAYTPDTYTVTPANTTSNPLAPVSKQGRFANFSIFGK